MKIKLDQLTKGMLLLSNNGNITFLDLILESGYFVFSGADKNFRFNFGRDYKLVANTWPTTILFDPGCKNSPDVKEEVR